MFEVEKPRRFHYEPRFYDPEKEKWEALKKKYAIEKEKEQATAHSSATAGDTSPNAGEEPEDVGLDYFEQRVRELDRQKRETSSRLTWRDLFRKREMPKFEYQPRFQEKPMSSESPENPDALVQKYSTPKHKIKIRRRFDIADSDYMKPIPGTKIILYTGIVCLLLAVIILL